MENFSFEVINPEPEKEKNKEVVQPKKMRSFMKKVTHLAAATSLMFSLGGQPKNGDLEKDLSLASASRIEKVENNTVSDLLEAAKENNFTADVQISAKQGHPYLVVIGQTHYVESDINQTSIDAIIKSQKQIESFIKLVVGKEEIIRKLYCEGETSASGQELIETMRDGLKEICVEKEVFEKVVKIYCKIFEYNDNGAVPAFVSHQFGNKIIEICDYYKNNPEEFVQTSNYTNIDEASAWSLEQIKSPLAKKYGQDAFYLMGATYKLADEGIISVAASETVAANDNAKNNRGNISGFSDANETREDIAVNLAASDISGDANIRLLIYGQKHSFSDNVKKFNSANPDLAIGLITLSSN